MSYSTWHFITPSPSSGWLFRNMVLPRFVSMWQEMFEKTYVWFDCLEIIQRMLSQDGCLINTLQRILLHHSYRLHIRQLSRPRTSLWRYLLLWRRSTVVLSRRRSSSWPSRSSSCHVVAFPSFVPTFVVRWPPILPSSCRRADGLFRPAAAAPSALPSFLRGSATLRQFDTDQHERNSYTEQQYKLTSRRDTLFRQNSYIFIIWSTPQSV